MSAIPRYVTTAEEGAARIAGWIFGDGNPEHADGPLATTTLTALDTTSFVVPECTRIAQDLLAWVNGVDYRIASNGNFIVKRDSLYTALGHPTTPSVYYQGLAPASGFTPTRLQVESWLASVIEGEGSFSTNPPKIMDEARGGAYTQRIQACVDTMNTQSLGAFVSGNSAKCSLAALDAFPMPLISANRYPGDTPADWPDGAPPPPDTTPPPVPTGLTAVDGDASVGLSWTVTVAVDLAGYRLFRNGVQIYEGATPAFLDSGLTNGATYTYVVRSYDTSNNESASSTSAIGAPVAPVGPGDITPPSPPTALSGTPGATQVALSWTISASPDVASYRVYRGAVLISTVASPASSYVDTGLDPETEYTYRLTAVDTSGNESSSTAFISVTTLSEAVGPPAIVGTFNPITVSLGCADAYAVYVADRSGEVLLSELPFTGLSWGRVLDDVSAANFNLDLLNGGAECCRIIGGLQQYGYEFVVFRNGQRVWTGPVVDIIVRGEDVEVRCDDKMGWTKVRPLWTALNYPDPGEEMATIFNDVVTDCMAPDNVPGLIATAIPTGIRAVREYTTNPPQFAYDAIQELARSGIDYTMVGKTMVAGSFVVPTAPIAFFTEQALSDLPEISLLGANYASQWVVTGDPEQDLLASYGGIDAVSGLVLKIAQEDDIKDQVSLDQNAKSRWELTSGIFVNEATLHLDQSAPLPIELAVPGAVIDLRFADSCFPLVGLFRIKSVDVSVGGGDAPAESVSITVEPVGTELIA